LNKQRSAEISSLINQIFASKAQKWLGLNFSLVKARYQHRNPVIITGSLKILKNVTETNPSMFELYPELIVENSPAGVYLISSWV
jgi:hypothetical protein